MTAPRKPTISYELGSPVRRISWPAANVRTTGRGQAVIVAIRTALAPRRIAVMPQVQRRGVVIQMWGNDGPQGAA